MKQAVTQDHNDTRDAQTQPVAPDANPAGLLFRTPGMAHQQWQTLLGTGFSSTFEYAAIGMALVDLKGRCLAANRALCSIVGYTEQELLGQQFQTITHPEDLTDNLALGHRLINGEIPSFTLEKRYIHKDGHIVYVLLSASLLRDADGKPQFVISQIQDISERKHMEQKLRESEARYRSLVEASPDAIGAVDMKGRFVFVNRQFASMVGYDTPEDMLGVSIFTHLAPEDHKALIAGLARVLQAGVERNIEYTFLTRNGDPVPIEGSYSVIYDAEGQPSLLIGTARDITARKRGLRALRESEERYRKLVETSPDAIVMTDLDGKIIFGNLQLAQLHGYDSVEEVLGLYSFSAIVPEEHERMAEHMRKALELGYCGPVEYTLIHRDGSQFGGEINASVVRDASDKPVAFICVVRDISERTRAGRALRESEERYRKLVEASPIFIGVCVEGKAVFVNSAGLRLIGAERLEQVVGMPVLHFIHPDERAEAASRMEALLHGGTELSLREQRWVRIDGSVIDVESAAVPLVYQGQAAIQVVAHDITGRKRAEAAEREQRALSEALCDTAATLSSTLDLDLVLQRLLDNAGNVVPHDAANIMLVDPRHQEAYVARAQGYAEFGLGEWVKKLRLPLATVPNLRYMVETAQPVLVSDTKLNPEWLHQPETDWLRSYMAAAIRIKGQTIGFLNFDSATPGFFTQTHMQRAQAFADQAALAIENARLFKTTRLNVVHLTMLYQSGVALAKAESMEALYGEALHWARQLTEASIATLSLYDGKEHLVVVAASGMPKDVVGSRIALGEGVNGRAAQSRQLVQQHGYSDWDGRLLIFQRLGVVSVVGLPLLWQGQLVGTLSIADQREHEFSDEDMHMLTLLATLVAAALEQRRAVAEAQMREAEANALSSRLSHVQEEERVRIAEQLHDSIGHRLVALQKNIEGARALLGHDHPVAGHLATSVSVLQETHHQARSLAMDLNSKVLADVGISPAARQYIERLAESTGMRIRLHVTGRVRRLPAEVERVAFRGLQETVINAVRHGDAAEVNAQIHFGARSLRVTVQDNGRGFVIGSIEGCGNRNGKSTALGLPELRRQVEALQGEFIIESMPGQGTLVVLTLPVRAGVPDRAKARVLLVDDHETTRQGLRFALAQSDEFTCVGEAGDGLAAVHQVELSHPDLVVMDIQLPYLSGIEAARQICKRFPHVGIIMFSHHADEVYLEQALRAGARGYVLKSDESRQMIAALRAVHAGDVCVSPALMDKWMRLQERPPAHDPLEILTMRERQVYELIVAGSTNRDMSVRLGISVRTVEVHRKNIMDKLGLKNLAQLLQFARRYGSTGMDS